MKSVIQALTGGAVVIVVATLIGIAHNAVRSDPVQLIPKTTSAIAAEPVSAEPAPGDGVEGSSRDEAGGMVSVEEVKWLIDEGIAVVIDARGQTEYTEGHLPGAINVPYEEFAEHLDTLIAEAPLDQTVVCYCRGPLCDLSDHLATELRLMGYEDVRIFRGGWEHWTEAGHGLITGTEPE